MAVATLPSTMMIYVSAGVSTFFISRAIDRAAALVLSQGFAGTSPGQLKVLLVLAQLVRGATPYPWTSAVI
jgi:hypothetical protein